MLSKRSKHHRAVFVHKGETLMISRLSTPQSKKNTPPLNNSTSKFSTRTYPKKQPLALQKEGKKMMLPRKWVKGPLYIYTPGRASIASLPTPGGPGIEHKPKVEAENMQHITIDRCKTAFPTQTQAVRKHTFFRGLPFGVT